MKCVKKFSIIITDILNFLIVISNYHKNEDRFKTKKYIWDILISMKLRRIETSKIQEFAMKLVHNYSKCILDNDFRFKILNSSLRTQSFYD